MCLLFDYSKLTGHTEMSSIKVVLFEHCKDLIFVFFAERTRWAIIVALHIILLYKAKTQYLLTYKARHCLLANCSPEYPLIDLHVAWILPAFLKVIYHPLYGMNNDVLIWGDWQSCDLLRGSQDSQSPHIKKWQLWFICQKNIHTR